MDYGFGRRMERPADSDDFHLWKPTRRQKARPGSCGNARTAQEIRQNALSRAAAPPVRAFWRIPDAFAWSGELRKAKITPAEVRRYVFCRVVPKMPMPSRFDMDAGPPVSHTRI